jgi:puromycin-sensitive aminopeptidase
VITADVVDRTLSLRQQRFRYLPSPEDADARWEVPVLARRTSGEHGRVLLSDASASLPLGGTGAAVVNAGGWGVFRTRYSSELFAQLIAAFAELDAVERYNLVSDTWATVLADREPAGDFLELVSILGDERDPSVWEAALDGISAAYRAAPAAVRPRFSAWVRDLIGPVFADLGWEPAPGEHDGAAKLRGLLLNALGTIGDDAAIQAEARAVHAGLMSGERTVAPDLLAAIVSILAWVGGPDDYELFWDRIRNAATPQEEVRYLFRLASFPDAKLLQRTLDATLTEIRAQNGAFVIATGLANLSAGHEAWAWLSSHWDDVLKRVPDNSHGRLLEGIVRLIDAPSVRAIGEFLAEHPIPSARLQVDQLLERQRVNAAFAEREAPALVERFS